MDNNVKIDRSMAVFAALDIEKNEIGFLPILSGIPSHCSKKTHLC